MEGDRFTAEDIEKLNAIAEKQRSADINCRLLFATLRDALSHEAIALFRALRDRERIGGQVLPRPPIILTRGDLERDDFARRDELEGYYRRELERVASNRLYLSGDT